MGKSKTSLPILLELCFPIGVAEINVRNGATRAAHLRKDADFPSDTGGWQREETGIEARNPWRNLKEMTVASNNITCGLKQEIHVFGRIHSWESIGV